METSLSWLGRLATAPSGLDWHRLSDAYGPLVRTWFAHTGIPPADQDDLTQEVLLVVVARVSDFDHRGPGAFRAWLRGIVANQARKFFRDRKANAAIDLDQLSAGDNALSQQWDREHDEYLATRALRAVEAEFSSANWQAFQRQVVEGQKAADVASELGMSVNSALLAKSRVLKRLRVELRGLVE
jgi:RNA polymerase sigma-70 factor (ECF subfamily)